MTGKDFIEQNCLNWFMNLLEKIVEAIELHSAEGIRQCLEQGLDPNTVYRNEPILFELTIEYTRSPAFKDCVRAFAEHGLEMEYQALLAVLLNDATHLDETVRGNPEALHRSYTLRCAYTPLYKATLLHICAEFNHVDCAAVLVKHGMDINARAGKDENGFGGQTPIFHTVNQNGNQSMDMLNYLLSQSADLKLTLTGLIWGKGYPWETFIPAVNPVNYAMMGLLPQMHRKETTVSEIVSLLLNAAYGIDYIPANVPNQYLKS
jgi:hypothetical protein